MKRFLTAALTAIGYIIVVIGIKSSLLGALYKIQSWESPTIGGTKLNLLLLGLLLTSGGAMLVLAAKLMKKEDRLELDPNLVAHPAAKVEELLQDDDQYV